MHNRTVRATDGASLHLHTSAATPGLPAIVLLHGLTGTGDDWRHVFDLDELAMRFQVIRPDARGHGRSTDPAGAFGFRRCARDVLEILDALAIDRVRAVGMSLGAKTLLHVASLAPERIEAMVLVSPAPRFPEATRAIFRAASEAEHGQEEWDAMRLQHPGGDDQIRALWALPGRFAGDLEDHALDQADLAKIQARTLVVAGDSDPLYPVELAVEIFRGIPRCSLAVVPGGGHGPIFATPDKDERTPFRAMVSTFFAGRAKPAATG
jgi:pimeloyl-ACP methyl ester carboxylesterase